MFSSAGDSVFMWDFGHENGVVCGDAIQVYVF